MGDYLFLPLAAKRALLQPDVKWTGLTHLLRTKMKLVRLHNIQALVKVAKIHRSHSTLAMTLTNLLVFVRILPLGLVLPKLAVLLAVFDRPRK